MLYAVFLQIKICKNQLNNLRRYNVNVLISWYFLEQFINSLTCIPALYSIAFTQQ